MSALGSVDQASMMACMRGQSERDTIAPMPDSRDKTSRWINVALVVAILLAPVAWYGAAVNGPPKAPPELRFSGSLESGSITVVVPATWPWQRPIRRVVTVMAGIIILTGPSPSAREKSAILDQTDRILPHMPPSTPPDPEDLQATFDFIQLLKKSPPAVTGSK